MIWTPLPLQLSDEQVAELLAAYEPVKRHLEQRMGLPPAQLNTLREKLSQALEQHDAFREVLKQRAESGSHYVLHLQHENPEVLSLPWGLVLDPISQRPLGQVERLYLSQGSPQEALSPYEASLAAPLKILVMVASPVDSPYERRLPSRRRNDKFWRPWMPFPLSKPLMYRSTSRRTVLWRPFSASWSRISTTSST